MTKHGTASNGGQFGDDLDPIPDILPFGGISLVAGAAGAGKTALLATMMRDFRDNRPIFGHQPSLLTGLGVVSADRGWERGAGFWFKRAGFGDIRHYCMTDDRTFDPRSLRKKFDRTNRLIEFIDKLKLPPGSLVLVDPIGMFLGGNLCDYDSCAIACCELRAMLRDRGLTLLGSAHTAKMKADKKERYLRLQDAILGSAALFGFGDTQMYLACPDELNKPHYSFLWHSHQAPVEVFNLERDDQGLFHPYTGADRGNCARVLALVPENGAEVTLGTVVELAEAYPLTRRTVQRILLQLVDEGAIEKVRYGAYKRVLKH